jgi:hypothetical protein
VLRSRRASLVVRLLAIPVLIAALWFAVTRTGEPELLEPSANGPLTILGSLVIEPKAPVAGQVVTARARISADRPVRLETLVVKVRDELGAFHDFQPSMNYDLGTADQDFVVTQQFTRPGLYSYYLSYRTASGWTSLPPWQGFTVR